ncbi:MAG TPA: epoxide hydrolase [Terriglobales bacterium]|jgi:pimeloyl-ACP methyl ester carboxylesterase
MIEPFEPSVSPETFDTLRERLRATRWPIGVVEDGGVPLATMHAIVENWLRQFDWEALDRTIRALPHVRTTVNDLRLHAVHRRAENAEAPAILLLHGWPGSFLEFLPMLSYFERLHVVIPSLPGFGFSDAPRSPGMSNAHMAECCAALMSGLGYARFVVHGGDIGAGVATWLARKYPARVTGLHLNFIPGSYTPAEEPPPTAEERDFLRRRAAWIDANGGYGHVQRTRPLTLAYGLADSPAALAAWIVEKFREWADPTRAVPLDTVLANVTLYWATNTIASSMRVYLESARTPLVFAPGERLAVPCAIARFPHEMPSPPRSWVERGYQVVRWTEMPRGGHFAALEVPDLLAADILEFLETLAPDRTI